MQWYAASTVLWYLGPVPPARLREEVLHHSRQGEDWVWWWEHPHPPLAWHSWKTVGRDVGTDTSRGGTHFQHEAVSPPAVRWAVHTVLLNRTTVCDTGVQTGTVYYSCHRIVNNVNFILKCIPKPVPSVAEVQKRPSCYCNITTH